MSKNFKCVLIGDVNSTAVALDVLHQNCATDVEAVISTSNNDYNSDAVNLFFMAAERGIKGFDIDNIDFDLANWLVEKNIDFIFVIGFSRLVSKAVIKAARIASVGFHPSLLPQNRGRHPIIWAIALGLKETGSTFFLLEETVDSGAILNQMRIEITEKDNATTVYNKVIELIPVQLTSIINNYKTDNYQPQKQDEKVANVLRKRSWKDGLIDWRMSTHNIVNLVRALTKPYPGAQFCSNGSYVTVSSALPFHGYIKDNIEPGKVLDISTKGPLIKTGDSGVYLADFHPNYDFKIGEYL